MKNSADLGGGYPPRPSASVDNTLLDLQNSSYPTQPHSIIAKYALIRKTQEPIDIVNKAWQKYILLNLPLSATISKKIPMHNTFNFSDLMF